MLKSQLITIVLLLLFFSNLANVSAQLSEPVFLKMDYLSIPASEESDVKTGNLISDLEDKLDRELITGWSLYKVVAGESENAYNYVAIYNVEEFGDIDQILTLDTTSEGPVPSVKFSELWQRDHVILPDDQQNPGGNYLTINYFDSRGGTGEHEEMEVDFWGAIHEIRIAENILNSWGMYTLLYPGGMALDYTYATIDFYNEPADMREPVGMELAAKAHTGLSEDELSEYFERTADSRSGYKSELWRKLDSNFAD